METIDKISKDSKNLNDCMVLIDLLESYSRKINKYGVEGLKFSHISINKFSIQFNIDSYYTSEFFKIVQNLCVSSWHIKESDTSAKNCTIKTEWKHSRTNDFQTITIDSSEYQSYEPIKDLFVTAIQRVEIDFEKNEDD